MTNSVVPPKLRGVRLLPGLMALSLVCMVLAAGLLFFAPSPGTQGSPEGIGRAALLTQTLPLKASGALHGDPKAFAGFDKDRKELASLLKGSTDPAVAGDARWKKIQDAADKVMEGREPAQIVGKSAAEVRELMPKLLAEMGNLSGVAGGNKIDAIGRQLERFELSGQRLQQDLDALAAGIGDLTTTAQRIADSTDFLGQVLAGFAGEDGGLGLPKVSGAEAEQRLKSAQGLYSQVNERAREAVSATQGLASARTAATDLATAANAFAGLAPASIGGASAGGRTVLGTTLPLVLIGIAALTLIAVGVIYLSLANIRRAAETHAKQNERNQEAILRLLDELSSLADGDLTVQATVTEDITGAIADSINYAIEALRELVTTINDSAIHLDGAAKQTQALAAHLAKASSAQSKQIASATDSTAEMAASTEEVSGNAERASDVARHSVDVAHKGGDAVRRTIDGMNTIRETIQETSKRIKRLGESSQEIGNIVELINDIAEQTNILALNASIQASMAGEAGRGFAVVADEVQRLAERAANATKQIEVLVRTIQTDTNEAVVSMERSTTDVVGGALLAENAGAALEEIEQVSNQIASLVQNISASSRGQAGAAGNISRNMQVLREISSQTVDSTSATSQSIAKLAELSAQLRKSVAGFRLPSYTPPPAASVAVAKPVGPRPAPDSSPAGTMRKVSAGA
jgi:twitching motility protein PilJ